jgi:hypothetical protein
MASSLISHQVPAVRTNLETSCRQPLVLPVRLRAGFQTVGNFPLQVGSANRAVSGSNPRKYGLSVLTIILQNCVLKLASSQAPQTPLLTLLIASSRASIRRGATIKPSLLLPRNEIICEAASTPTAETEWEDYPLPEGDLGLPIVGQTFQWLRHYMEFYRDW